MNKLLEQLMKVETSEFDRGAVQDDLKDWVLTDFYLDDKLFPTVLHLVVQKNNWVVLDEVLKRIQAEDLQDVSKLLKKRNAEGLTAFRLALDSKKKQLLAIFVRHTEVLKILTEEVFEDKLTILDCILQTQDIPNLALYFSHLKACCSGPFNKLYKADSHLRKICSLNIQEPSDFFDELQDNSMKKLQISCVRQLLSRNGETSEAMLEDYFIISLRSQNYELVEMLGEILGFDKLKQEPFKKKLMWGCLEKLCPLRRNAVFSPDFAFKVIELLDLNLDHIFEKSNIHEFVFRIECFGPQQDAFVLWLLRSTVNGTDVFAAKIADLIEVGAIGSLRKLGDNLKQNDLRIDPSIDVLTSAIKGYMRETETRLRFHEADCNIGETFDWVQVMFGDENGFSKLDIAHLLHPFRSKAGFYKLVKMLGIAIEKNLVLAVQEDDFPAAESIVAFIDRKVYRRAPVRRRQFRVFSASKRRSFEQTISFDSAGKCLFCQVTFKKHCRRKQISMISPMSYVCEHCYFGDCVNKKNGIDALEYTQRLGKTKFYSMIKFAKSEVGVFLRSRNQMCLSQTFMNLGIESLESLQRLNIENLKQAGIMTTEASKLINLLH